MQFAWESSAKHGVDDPTTGTVVLLSAPFGRAFLASTSLNVAAGTADLAIGTYNLATSHHRTAEHSIARTNETSVLTGRLRAWPDGWRRVATSDALEGIRWDSRADVFLEAGAALQQVGKRIVKMEKKFDELDKLGCFMQTVSQTTHKARSMRLQHMLKDLYKIHNFKPVLPRSGGMGNIIELSHMVPVRLSEWVAARGLPVIEGSMNGPQDIKARHIVEHMLVDATKGATLSSKTCDAAIHAGVEEGGCARRRGAHDYVSNVVGNLFFTDT